MTLPVQYRKDATNPFGDKVSSDIYNAYRDVQELEMVKKRTENSY